MKTSKKGVKVENTEESIEVEPTVSDELSYEEKLEFVNPISKPMASKKLTKRVLKLAKKAMKRRKASKGIFQCGVKAVNQSIRKGAKGIVVIAGDIWPIDILCHMPAVCEERNIPYVYVPSKKDIGMALKLFRCTMILLISEHDDYKDLYEKCVNEINSLPLPIT